MCWSKLICFYDHPTNLRADCADVTILLKHYYYGAHGQTIKIPAQTDTRPRNRITFPIGAGVTHQKLRMALVNIGTAHFQDMRKADRIISYFGGSTPILNLAAIVRAGLSPGDVLVWKKLDGIGRPRRAPGGQWRGLRTCVDDHLAPTRGPITDPWRCSRASAEAAVASCGPSGPGQPPMSLRSP